MHILFVDDNADTRHLFSMAFVLRGHRCLTASNALEGLELLSASTAEPFDAAVLDIHMADMDGMEMLRRVKSMPQGAHIAVILHTAYHTPEIEAAAKAEGACACLRKPILTSNMIEVVEAIVERCRVERGQDLLS